jgi:hypothetical protein
MKNKKYVTGLVIAVAGLVLALAPTAQAVTLSDGHTGDYRIIFVTLGEHGAKDIAIGPYNTFVSDQAGLAASTQTSGHSTTWTAVASTTGTSAREASLTTGAGTDIHIYTPQGADLYELVATSYDDLWDSSILTGIHYGDGTEAGDGTGGDRIWTGSKADGTQDDWTVDASGPLGTGLGGSNTGTSPYITTARGGYTNGRWIAGPNDHDGESNNGNTFTRSLMGMSGVITNVPEPSDLAFTWIHLDPVSDRLALQWASRDEVLYDLLYSNDPTATFDPSAWSILTNGVSGTESSTEIFLPDFQGQSWSTVAPWWVFRLREQ